MRLLVFIFLLVSKVSWAQVPLNGHYTVGGTSPDYSTIAQALDSLYFHGVNDTVYFDIRNGNYSTYTINIASRSYNYPVIFQSETRVNTAVTVRMSQLISVRNLQFRDLTIYPLRNTSSNWTNKGLDIAQGINVVFENCRLIGQTQPGNNYKNGISLRACRGVTIKNCLFNNFESAMVFTGISYFGSNRYYDVNKVDRNVFTNCDLAIVLAGEFRDSTIVSNNRIRNCIKGIELDNSEVLRYTYIFNNLIQVTTDYGIESHSSGSWVNSVRIYNNMIIGGKSKSISISNQQGTTVIPYIASIYLNGDDGTKLYNNSMTGGIELWSSDNIEIYNNNVYTQASPALLVFGSSSYTADYNNYERATQGVHILDGFTPYNSIQQYINQTNQDSNSVSTVPIFTSSTDLHASSPLIHKKGTPIALVTHDFDGQLRNPATPDIGADEFQNDSNLQAIAYFSYSCAGNNRLQFKDQSVRSASVLWIFNNTDTSYLRNPLYQFPTSGNFSVHQTVYDFNGLGSSGRTLIINVPSFDTIQRVGTDSLMIPNNHSNYQWRLNGGILPGATSHVYKFLFPGTYWVEYTDNLGCSYTSDTVQVALTTSIDRLGKEESSIAIFPNPAKDQLSISFEANYYETKVIRVINLQGKVLLEKENRSNLIQLNLANLPSGAYLIEVNSPSQIFRQKFIKL